MMGVKGLLSYCIENRDRCVEEVDLVRIAQQREGIEILCDFYSLQQTLVENFWSSLALVSKNEYIRILGGEYTALDDYVTKFVNSLRAVDIDLVLVIDGAKGSSRVGTTQKLHAWTTRHQNETRKVCEVIDVCERKRKINEIPATRNVRPVLLEIQVIKTLQKCHCEIIQCVSGEADYVLAKHLLTREKAYAILSNDSDFCIFRNCTFIPECLFDLKNDLQLGGRKPIHEKPEMLECGVIRCDKVQQLLGFVDQSELVEMSIVAGNDFTGPHLDRLQIHTIMGIRRHRCIAELAKWVVKYRCPENHPEIYLKMMQNPEFAEAVKQSRAFYLLAFDPEAKAGESTALTGVLREQIRRLEVPAHVMAMHRCFYWHRIIIEDVRSGRASCEVALTPLRRFIYKMVVDRCSGYQPVFEYGRSTTGCFEQMTVHYSPPKNLCTADRIEPENTERNLELFSQIMSHMETGVQPDYFHLLRLRDGFICYITRYFLKLNTSCNLIVSRDDIQTLIAAAFATEVDVEFYQSLAICPSVRCVTLFNWMQNVYRYAYHYIGQLLYLSEKFPSPAETFSGAVFTGFYMIRNPTDNVCAATRHQFSARILMDYEKVIREKQKIISLIIQDI